MSVARLCRRATQATAQHYIKPSRLGGGLMDFFIKRWGRRVKVKWVRRVLVFFLWANF